MAFLFSSQIITVLWHCQLDNRKGVQPVKTCCNYPQTRVDPGLEEGVHQGVEVPPVAQRQSPAGRLVQKLVIFCKLYVKKLILCGTDDQLLLSGFQALMTLTLDRVIQYTVVRQSSNSIYINFFVDKLSVGTPPSSRSSDTKTRTNSRTDLNHY